MPYLCIDRHNHKYYKPINPYCKGVRGNWRNVFLIGEGTLLREICLHATVLTLALPSAGVFEGLLSKDISRRSCALTNGNILQLGGADACRLIVVQQAGEAEKILICMRLCAWQMEFFSVSLWNEKVSYNFN